MEDCIFCKIIKKEIPSYKVYEDEHVYAFLDLSQTTQGHTLVIPKKHVKDIFDCDEQTASELFARLPKISRALEQAFPNMAGLNIVNNNKAIAYQSVFHSHVHLIPRYSVEDQFSIGFSDNSRNYSKEEMTVIADKIHREVTN